jgi:PKD repeat protein
VQRAWTFFPGCAAGACKRVTLARRRSSRHLVDVLVLQRRGRGLYAGTGHFWVALLCAGQAVPHGGLAAETVTVRITHTVLVGTTRFATALRATYNNPSRTNLTRCPGGIGRDAAVYSGRLASPLPGPPTASFAATPALASSSATFADRSQPGRGGAPIVGWSWNFGDQRSANNTSTQQNPAHQYSVPGTYTVTLRIRDRYGQSATTTAQVTV